MLSAGASLVLCFPDLSVLTSAGKILSSEHLRAQDTSMLITSPSSLALLLLSIVAGFKPIAEVGAVDYSTDAVVVPLDLSSYLNNKGTSDAPGQADLNGQGWSIPYAGFPTGSLPYRGIEVRNLLI